MKTNRNLHYDGLVFVRKILSVAVIGLSALFFSCGNSPQPARPFIVLRSVFKTNSGKDLLDQSQSYSFKKSDLKVICRADYNGTVKDVSFNNNENGIEVYLDNDLRFFYFDLVIPTNADKNPIETFVTLSNADVDTVTYTYNPNRFKNVPDKIFYNKKLVWDVASITSSEGIFPPLIVIK